MSKYLRYSAVLLLTAACVDAPTGPTLVPDLGGSSAALIGAPDPADPNSWEGDLYICKDGTASTMTFAFSYDVRRESDNVSVASGVVNVPMGSCVKAADVSPLGNDWFRASVSEGALPANWSLGSIDLLYNRSFTRPPAATIDVGAGTVTNISLSNDVGAQVTFTNTYTPPPPPPYCTLTQGYWKTHTEDWDEAGERVVQTTDLFFNSGKTYIEIMNMPPAGGNSYLQLAHQYIAAVLNLNGASDPVINSAISTAAGYFAGHTAGSYFIKNAGWTSLAGTLDGFNNGLIGPGHCDD